MLGRGPHLHHLGTSPDTALPASQADSQRASMWTLIYRRQGRLTELPETTLAGVNIANVNVTQATTLLVEAAVARRPLGVHLCNAYTLVLASQRPEYATALNYKALNLPDGVPLTWFSRLQGGGGGLGPVRGPSLMRHVLAVDELRHFMLGGTPESNERLLKSVRRHNPGVRVVGTLAPPFAAVTAAELDDWVSAIQACTPHVVWVGLGTPKQDEVIAALVDRVDAVLVGVGAAFDFLSGAKKEAPSALRGTGLEWMHRLSTEPRRLWRRYLIGNVSFAFLVARELRLQRHDRRRGR